MSDMLIQCAACRDRSQVRGIRQRRHLITEVGTCDTCTCGSRKRHTQSTCNSHQGNTHGCNGTPGGTGNNRNHCLDQERGNQHEFRVYDLDAVINHHRNGTGCHPGTNHSANTYKNQDGRHALCDLGADLIHHLIPGNAYTERDKCCDCSYHDQKRLCAVAEYAFSDGKDQEHCDDRCDRFRKSGQTFGPFFLFFHL